MTAPGVHPLGELAEIHQGMALAGRGPGARRGDFRLRMIEAHDLGEGMLADASRPREIDVAGTGRNEHHLLRPYDILVSARSSHVMASLVPPGIERTVASVTLLVARPRDVDAAPYLWWFLRSAQGQLQLKSRLTTGATVTSLSAASLGAVTVPMPAEREIPRLAKLIEAAEDAYQSEMEAARVRRETLREAIIADICGGPAPAAAEQEE